MTCGRPWAEQHERQDRALTGLATAVLERAAAQLGERVLDIGCRAGTTVLALAVQVGPDCTEMSAPRT
jgi:cyclopropane fatty-acyl-phospholipid synthase-like methyltransferase